MDERGVIDLQRHMTLLSHGHHRRDINRILRVTGVADNMHLTARYYCNQRIGIGGNVRWRKHLLMESSNH